MFAQPRSTDKAKTLGTNIRAGVHFCRAIRAVHDSVRIIARVHSVAAQIFGAWSFITILGHVKKSTIDYPASHTYFMETHKWPHLKVK